ncbi:DNA primase [Muribaculaceae bacterium Isolate-002 (NCI)]|nr:DNA primase [Muribaculaceae bacterium Isolate-002 (NCI)]
MGRIDRETVQKILDTADIVDVVSDFVTLKRRGANYIGLCPFHNERTPSFSVSKSKGICKCFSCGKGGSPVNFIMEHEKMSFNEALRYLAKKYNIEIKERELSDSEREEESDRENMFNVNEFALSHFENNLSNTDEGRDIGYSYFRERGISDTAIKRFRLGYSIERGNELLRQARERGYNEKYLIDTGLVVRRDDGTLYDRFKGRVIYPVHTISGKVVAFGGRTLRNDKKMAKYVNSPESVIYSKSRELYGLYQAKKSISEKDKCILVEGYMDVISMSQSGIENVVASSGTSLTQGQIRLIHRFTSNVTLIYDSDPAGIKASLRGIDMLLAEGLNMKVVLLPDGDDPDSFAQSHSATEVEEYIAAHETDFIRFKTDILLKDAANDPIARSKAISDIVRSISVIPDDIVRSLYVKECSRTLDIDEKVLLLQIKKNITERAEQLAQQNMRDKARASLGETATEATAQPQSPETAAGADRQTPQQATADAAYANPAFMQSDRSRAATLTPFEYDIARYIVRYGMVELPTIDDDNQPANIRVIDYIMQEFAFDNISFSNPIYNRLVKECRELIDTDWESDRAAAEEHSLQQRQEQWDKGTEEIRRTAINLDQITQKERMLLEEIDAGHYSRLDQHTEMFFIRRLTSSPDDEVRREVTRMASSKHKLSKVHSKYAHVESERERLDELLPRAIYALKDAMLQCDIRSKRDQLKQISASGDMERIRQIMLELASLDSLRRDYAQKLGDRVILPKK